MTGTDLKTARLSANWTQQRASSKLGLTQAYLSMVECGLRPVSSQVAARAFKVFSLPPTALPLEPSNCLSFKDDDLKSDLGALGYPGFGYLGGKPANNPARLLFYALDRPDLDARVVEALPWLTSTYVDLDWGWLVRNAKLNDRQNRLGFVTTLAAELAKRSNDEARLNKLTEHRTSLDRSRLAREDTLCHDSMTKAERKWLQHNRGPEARHWNLLTDLDVKHLAYAPA
jgi:transcriptional regulator with XRE-family HTH domain